MYTWITALSLNQIKIQINDLLNITQKCQYI